MRPISTASLAKISGTSNIEPVIVVRIWWGGTTYITYADKKFTQQGLVGRLTAISGIEDIVDINASSSSVNMSITLDDSDGSIKNIFDYNDIHKTYVQVLQWFADLPLSDAFSLFEGEISSPIIWSEGDRTLKFDVVSMLEDQEVGFSADEAQFNYMPSDLVGKAWPIVFGTVQGLKPLAINETPSAILAMGFGIVNDDAWEAELGDISKAIEIANRNAELAYDFGEAEAVTASFYKGPTAQNGEDPVQAAQHDSAAAGYYAQSTNYRNESRKLGIEYSAKLEEYDFQKSLEFRVLAITQTNLPSGVTFTAEIGDYTCSALVVGNAVIISNLTEKIRPNEEVGTSSYDFPQDSGNVTSSYSRTDKGSSQKFVWIDGGTSIRVYEFPVQYIVSVGHVSVFNVYAKSKYGTAIVPPNYYQVSHQTFHPKSGDLVNFSALKVTYLTIPVPLQTLDPEFWTDGEIEVDTAGFEPGTNVADIMTWAILNFSGLGYNAEEFLHVRNQTANYPANFVLQERKNVMTFLKEVAFQARCAIWINDRIFRIQYLPIDGGAVDTITDDDVEVNSLVITSSESERLVTKFVANWNSQVDQSEPNQVILRYNVLNYGSIEETYDFYIYNNYAAVAAAAQFWMIRKSNTWKLLQCKVALNKLRIEAFDYVNFTLNDNCASIGTIKGQITKATFNPDDDSISIEAWLPVRFGEMHQYNFAYPGTTQAIYPALDDVNIQTGNPYADSFVPMDTNLYLPPAQAVTISPRNPPTQGTGQPSDAPPPPFDIITALSPNEIGKTRPENLKTFNNTTKRQVANVTIPTTLQDTSTAFYGEVVEKKSDNLYTCLVWKEGFDGRSREIDVRIGKIREGSIIPPETPLTVHRTVWKELDPSKGVVLRSEYWAQPPIWIPPVEDEDS